MTVMLYGYFHKWYVKNFKFQAYKVLAVANTKVANANNCYKFI